MVTGTYCRPLLLQRLECLHQDHVQRAVLMAKEGHREWYLSQSPCLCPRGLSTYDGLFLSHTSDGAAVFSTSQVKRHPPITLLRCLTLDLEALVSAHLYRTINSKLSLRLQASDGKSPLTYPLR